MRKEVGWKWQHSIGLAKLFSLRVSAKSLQALSCESLKTTPRTMFLSFGIKNCFPIAVLRRNFMKIPGNLQSRGKSKHRYWFFADAPNIARNCRVICKDLWLWADSYRRLKYRGGCTKQLFQLIVWCEKCVASRHYSVIWKQLYFANNRNRVRGAVLCL